MYRKAQKEYPMNKENICQESQKKELTRLKNMPDSLKNFVTALKINPTLIENAIENHNTGKDLIS